MIKPVYKRILLKLSGEALMGEDSYGINRGTIERMVADIAELSRLNIELAIVIGGGNIFRGVAPGCARYGSGYSRLHGDAGNRHEFPSSGRCHAPRWRGSAGYVRHFH